MSEGFNATYKILSCPENCPDKHVCRGGHCMCADGWTGTNCSTEMCPGNCSSDKKQGTCDKVSNVMCYCDKMRNVLLDPSRFICISHFSQKLTLTLWCHESTSVGLQCDTEKT